MIDIENPPKEVKQWIKRLKRCFTEQPNGVWFFVSDSEVHVMACGKEGERIMDKSGGVDSDYRIDSIPVDDIDGGGW